MDHSPCGDALRTKLGGTTNSFGTITRSPAIAALLALTKSCTAANQFPNSHTYELDSGASTSICSLKGGPGNAGGALFYTADMDTDCDGIIFVSDPEPGRAAQRELAEE
jgi:hypothetical protein